MARRRRKGVMPAGLKRYWAARRGRKAAPRRKRRASSRRRARRNPVGLAAFNPPRRRRRSAARSFRRRGRALRNPRMFAGLNIQEIAFAGGAVLLAPFIERQVAPLLPASFAGTKGGRWAVKIGSAVITWQAWRMLLGKKHGDIAALVLGANLVSDAAQEFMPSLTGGLTAYTPRMNAYVPRPGLSGRRGMGLVTSGPVVPMSTMTPTGLRFRGRFGR